MSRIPVVIKLIRFLLVTSLLVPASLIMTSGDAHAQIWPLSGGRAISRDGRWMAPIASMTLSSDEADHRRRGSVDAWDISAPFGTAVYPMGPGQVVYAGCNNVGGYGCWVMIDHKNDYTSLVAHLIDEGDGHVWVKSGDIVGTWTPLGRVGWTGMTSFGPHIHWEIRHKTQGRLRIDSLFPRYQMEYCKFCGSTDQSGGLRTVVSQQIFQNYSSLFTPQFMVVIFLIVLVIAAVARPTVAINAVRGTGIWMLRAVNASSSRIVRFRQSATWSLAHIAILIMIPSLLCGSTTALSVWIVDEGLTPANVWRYVRFGLSPVLGPGYQVGHRYAAVWGTPCHQVGTLGKVCRVDEIIQTGLAWREDVFQFTNSQPTFVIIPRLSSRFSYSQMEELITEAHFSGGLVIADVEVDMLKAQEAIDRLTPSGLDGVAIDIEFADMVTAEEIERLANYLAQRRRQAGLKRAGVLVVWDVFHNIKIEEAIDVKGVEIVPIFTGYGSTESKIAGLTITQTLFEARPIESGLMAFDQRWPINRACRNPDTDRGYDCQDWRTLFTQPEAGAVGWWVQQ